MHESLVARILFLSEEMPMKIQLQEFLVAYKNDRCDDVLLLLNNEDIDEAVEDHDRPTFNAAAVVTTMRMASICPAEHFSEAQKPQGVIVAPTQTLQRLINA